MTRSDIAREVKLISLLSTRRGDVIEDGRMGWINKNAHRTRRYRVSLSFVVVPAASRAYPCERESSKRGIVHSTASVVADLVFE